MPIAVAELEAAIKDAIPVSHLEIEDQSNGCGENYAIILVSEAFQGRTTLARHRMSAFCAHTSESNAPKKLTLVNDLLKTQIAQMHAFSQKTFTPEQYEKHLAKAA